MRWRGSEHVDAPDVADLEVSGSSRLRSPV